MLLKSLLLVLAAMVVSSPVLAQDSPSCPLHKTPKTAPALGLSDSLAQKRAQALSEWKSRGLEQPDCCAKWDAAAPEQKAGIQHIHGKLGPLANVPVLTLTDPQNPRDNPHCKNGDDKLRKPCMPKGHKMVQDGKAEACGCGRKCGEKGDISGCGLTCCPEMCGCGECLTFDRRGAGADGRRLIAVTR